ncbi:unnamed protein product [Arctia plantaginis]|uniref:Uncharacterized protein n=1 Tax=Arctia plantaginis TaxID=874455 RepID=A0A8S1AJK9_ARCPL|nr:unnamed protein product [Arctia plantaginis]
MEILIFMPIYIVLVTFFVTVNAQTTGLNILTDTTKIPEKDVVDNSRGNSIQNEPVALTENKNRVEEKLFHILSGTRRELKENNSTSKITQVPLNLVIDTKPRTIPIKIPLTIKTGNVKPAPAHYIRLKGNTDRRNSKTTSPTSSSSNKPTSRKNVAIKDKVKSKSTNKSVRNHKSKNSKFFEDTRDSNDTSLLKEPKSVNPKKNKKMKNNHDSSTKLKPEKETDNELKHETRKHETVCNCDETINIENGTHSVLISKLPLSIQYEIKSKEVNKSLDKNLQDYVPKENPLTLLHNELGIIPAPISENTTMAVIAIDYDTQDPDDNLSDNKYIETAVKETPIVSVPVDPEIESPEVIRIKDHNYQEIEERRLPSYPEQITVDEYKSEPWATETLNPVSTHTYDTYVPNYQTAYSNYLKLMTENNSPIYNEGNCYPRSNILDPVNTYAPEVPQILSSPVKEVVQDIYEPNLGYQSNTINLQPENSVGRIWRTWKDTEIKLNRPKYARNRPFQLRRNSIGIIYGEHGAKMPSILRLQPVSPGKYNNLNNMWPYLNSGQLNRYLL